MRWRFGHGDAGACLCHHLAEPCGAGGNLPHPERHALCHLAEAPSCTPTGTISSCGSIDIIAPDLGPGESTTGTVLYATGSGTGSGTLKLKVVYGSNNATGIMNFTVASPEAPTVVRRNRPIPGTERLIAGAERALSQQWWRPESQAQRKNQQLRTLGCPEWMIRLTSTLFG